MPSSIEAWIAAIDRLSSVPPHIQPPIAQVPSPTAEASMPDEPISRSSISCDILQSLHGFEHGSGRLLVEDQRVQEAPVERGSDRQHLLGPGRDADRAGAAGDRSDGSSATRREFSGWSATVPSSRIRCARNSPRTPLSISSSRSGVGKRIEVVIARVRVSRSSRCRPARPPPCGQDRKPP